MPSTKTHTTRPSLQLMILGTLAVLVAGFLCALLPHAASAAARAPVAHAAKTGCASPYPAKRDPSNPLDLSVAPGSNPLNGARFTDPGAYGGNYAATAIASSRSFGGPQTWGPGSCIAPNPIRLTVRPASS